MGKIIVTGITGRFQDESDIGTVHLEGSIDTTACGIPDEDYETKATNKPITCEACKDMLAWAKSVSKIRK